MSTALHAAARYGIPVQTAALAELEEAMNETVRLRRAILEAIQHHTHGRPWHALRALTDAIEQD